MKSPISHNLLMDLGHYILIFTVWHERCFSPVDIYGDNVNSTDGLLRVLRVVQHMEGFGLLDHPRAGHYSLLLVDVSLFWRLFRLLYSYSGLSPIRHDLFLCFGFWHAYAYAHVALWNQF